jgi:two pore calcium channel protein, plant
LFLLFLVTLLYAWFGCVLFVGTPEGDEHFSSLVESLWTLWICITTANYPDVMMLSYNNTRWTAIYFVSFMILSFFFIMNIILATVVNGYDSAIQTRKEQQSTSSTSNLIEAFRLMDVIGTGEIAKYDMVALFFIVRHCFPDLLHKSSSANDNDDDFNHAEILFALLDHDGSSTINKKEFMLLPTVLLVEIEKGSDYTPFVKYMFPELWSTRTYQALCSFIKSQYFERSIDVLVALNAIVVAIQSYPVLSSQNVNVDPKLYDGSINTLWGKFSGTVPFLLNKIFSLTSFV